MTVKWEDNMSDYLDKLIKLAKDETNTRNFLRDVLTEAHSEYIAPLMPQWNPNLINSPMEPEHQTVEMENGKASIELLYTGFTREERTKGLDLVYSEFTATGSKKSRHIYRDYALYQETGQDEYAPNFKGHHFVREGTKAYAPVARERMTEYVQRLLHLEKWQRKTEPWFIEDWDNYG